MDKDNSIGKVVGIYIQDKKGYPRKPISKGVFEKDKGLLGDAYSQSGSRQVSIFTLEGREEISSSDTKGLCTERFHENITIKDLDIEKLKIGSIIKIGETLQKITGLGKRCFLECKIIKEGETCPLSKQVIFTKVLKGGEIGVGDTIGKINK